MYGPADQTGRHSHFSQEVGVLCVFFFRPHFFPPATMCPAPSPSDPTEVLDPSCRYARRSEARRRSVTAAAACWAPGQLQGGGPLRWGDPLGRWAVRASSIRLRQHCKPRAGTARDPHQRLAQPSAAAPRSVAGARCARHATRRCCVCLSGQTRT